MAICGRAFLSEHPQNIRLRYYKGGLAKGVTRLFCRCGRRHERLFADPSGEPNSFPDAAAMQQKFLTLARPVLKNRADQFADAILSLERFDRVEKATQLGRQ